MLHVDFLKSLKALKPHCNTKKAPRTYHPKLRKEDLVCECRDGSGELKTLYKTKDELDYMLSSKSVKLKSFPCPYEKGWHLTKM